MRLLLLHSAAKKRIRRKHADLLAQLANFVAQIPEILEAGIAGNRRWRNHWLADFGTARSSRRPGCNSRRAGKRSYVDLINAHGAKRTGNWLDVILPVDIAG